MDKTPAVKPKQAKNKKYMLVRYGRMDTVGWFEHYEAGVPKASVRVVIKTERGLELGYIVGQLTSYRAGQFRLTPEQLQEYFGDSQVEFTAEPAGRIIRYTTAEDISEEKHLRKIAEEEMESCRRFAKELNLPMKVVDVEHLFGGERIIFYFMSETRVDFRELVKKLAHEYQTRIEMRQIGSRDEAKLLGDMESCGQECCCIKFLKTLSPVNMRMAKMQKATLDPSKISGYCGRLKCCLRYEDSTYTELKKQLPANGSRVKTERGEGRVVDAQILTQLVAVELDSGEKIFVPLTELAVTAPTTAGEKQDEIPDDQNQNSPDTEDTNEEKQEQQPIQ
jgi:cell fate regulator YaaT (PSP1 superfamily)